MNIKQANYEELIATYYEESDAKSVVVELAKLIDEGDENKINWLLRDYHVAAVVDKSEILFRRRADKFMKCCSVIEVAALADFIPDVATSEFAGEIKDVLLHQSVKPYYTEFYPEYLPQELSKRMEGVYNITEDISDAEAYRIMLSFLELDQHFEENLANGYLLRLLDSFTITKKRRSTGVKETVRFKDLVALMHSPQKFIDSLFMDVRKQGVLEKAVNEFSLFIQFCFDLTDLLKLCDNYPLIQRAIWSCYSYWFGILGEKLEAKLGKALDGFLSWVPPGDLEINADEAIADIQKYVGEARSVLVGLVSYRNRYESIALNSI